MNTNGTDVRSLETIVVVTVGVLAVGRLSRRAGLSNRCRRSGWVDLKGVSLNYTAAPGKADPADYFTSSDDLLNRIWYGGAYTCRA
ncbi:hypothetical protein ACFTY8_46955 [Streptomyces mirabilis]|uniref:hypothetical protein n=1 Tax=Streptomyces mirabilis TaxID=68239 RepID=UPI00363A5AD9